MSCGVFSAVWRLLVRQADLRDKILVFSRKVQVASQFAGKSWHRAALCRLLGIGLAEPNVHPMRQEVQKKFRYCKAPV
jgi:hypothetical protein